MAAVASPDLGYFPSRSSSRCSHNLVTAHPKAAEEVADLHPVAMAHLHKLHSRLRAGGLGKSDSRGSPAGEGQRFRVDNGFLRADSKGLGFRQTKDLKALIPGAVAAWGSSVLGADEGDGWLRVQGKFLPMFVNGIPVLSPEGPPAPAPVPWRSGHALPSPASPRSQRSASSAGAFADADTQLAPYPPPFATPLAAGVLPPMGPLSFMAPIGSLAPPMGPFAQALGLGGLAAVPTPCRLPRRLPTQAFPDFRVLFEELVSLLQKCQKKVARGSHPRKELAMLENLERLLAEELRVGGHAASWHYLLQELALTRQALQGAKAEPEHRGQGQGLLNSVDYSAVPQPGLGWASGASSVPGREVAEASEDSEPEESTQVAEILAEAARAGNDAEAAAAVAQVASRPRTPGPRRLRTAQRREEPGPASPMRSTPRGLSPPSTRPASIEDRCSELESCVARAQKARVERQLGRPAEDFLSRGCD
ncbi:pntB [Symbiodinium sp. CCMP2456]|nr:pntB [Symbiodinium sp. CCMP2456]